MRPPTFKQLQAAARVAELGTVTRAAEQLNLSPSAISSTLKQLEENLGLNLFERTDEGFKLTTAGKEVIRAEAQIDAIISELTNRIGELSGGQRGFVNLGVVSTAKYFAPFILRAFQAVEPRIELHLKVGNREEIMSRLEDFTIDMAMIGRPPAHIEVEMEEVGPHPHVVIAAPDHRLAKHRHVSASALAQETFLVREPGSGTRMLTERILSQIGAAPKPGMEISSNETIKQAVMAGLGISMLSYHTVAHEVQVGRLAILRVEGTPVLRKWYIARNKKKQLLPSPMRFWEFMKTNGGKYLPVLDT
jgi:LysR family transcriptional regulator, low CO2-responsive transcriptional regulator